MREKTGADLASLSERSVRSAGEDKLLAAKRAQLSEVGSLEAALREHITDLQQLKEHTADGAIDGTEAQDLLQGYREKQPRVMASAQAGLQASESFSALLTDESPN